VVICTRHDTHAELTEAALRAGKHVLVEKPLGITEPEIDRIMEAHAGAGRVLTVGTNRRYSPAARAARAALAVWGGPIMVVCRINAGAIPASHWTQDRRVGGGRIIGEVCHFLDLCGYLVGDDVMVEKAQAAGIDPGRGPITALDNVSITLSYGDGSVATIVYAAVGAKEQPKELVEVMARGRSLVIDDFASLRGFGSGAPSIEAGRRDKGHARELDELARAIRGQPSELVSAESSAATARLAVRIDEALRGD
jgi:predicted dehydrogenase